jgi:glycopeptide antibiotics resistance protein
VFGPLRPLVVASPAGLFAATIAVMVIGWTRSRQGQPSGRAYGSAALHVLAVASLISVLILTLPPSAKSEQRVELVPFKALVETSRPTRGTVIAEMAANILLFVPVGFFVPACWRALDGPWRVILAGAGFSLLIETLQLALNDGRQASSTDVLMNTIGAALGYVLLRLIRLGAQRPAAGSWTGGLAGRLPKGTRHPDHFDGFE